jgi:hypothetical protein
MLEPYTGSPSIFFGTLAVVALIGAFVPVLFGKETVGQLETVTEAIQELTSHGVVSKALGLMVLFGNAEPPCTGAHCFCNIIVVETISRQHQHGRWQLGVGQGGGPQVFRRRPRHVLVLFLQQQEE